MAPLLLSETHPPSNQKPSLKSSVTFHDKKWQHLAWHSRLFLNETLFPSPPLMCPVHLFASTVPQAFLATFSCYLYLLLTGKSVLHSLLETFMIWGCLSLKVSYFYVCLLALPHVYCFSRLPFCSRCIIRRASYYTGLWVRPILVGFPSWQQNTWNYWLNRDRGLF